MWFKQKSKNRRANRARDVLDVKLRSSQRRAVRTRLAGITFGACFGIVLAVYVAWRGGQWLLNRLVYQNRSFAIQQVEIVTDGVISPDQLRRWSGVRPGQNLLALDLPGVKRDLELVPAIRSASLERVLPSTLRIRISEREPVAQIRVPRPRAGGGIELVIFQIDTDGCVMVPLDPRQRAVPLNVGDDQLPVICGLNSAELQPGRKLDSPQVRAALELIDGFESSRLAGLVDLKRIDVASPSVLVATTGQGSEITFALDNISQQIPRWQAIHELGARMNKTIATLDLAVANNVPARWVDASLTPPSPPKNAKPQRARKKNV